MTDTTEDRTDFNGEQENATGVFSGEQSSHGLKVWFEKIGVKLAAFFVAIKQFLSRKDGDEEADSFEGPMKRGFFDRKFNKAENGSIETAHETGTLSQFGGAGLINNHFSNSELEATRATDTDGDGMVNHEKTEETLTRREEATDYLRNTNYYISTAEANTIAMPEVFIPETTEDFVWLINKMPNSVLSDSQKVTLGKVMSFDSKKVSDIMTPKTELKFVGEEDYMGPLTLSGLYKSGQSQFPVVDRRGELSGILHAKTLFQLDIKDTDQASAFMDRKIVYLSENYPLYEALFTLLRSHAQAFVVVDEVGKISGLLDARVLLNSLLAIDDSADFTKDEDLASVVEYAKRFKQD